MALTRVQYLRFAAWLPFLLPLPLGLLVGAVWTLAFFVGIRLPSWTPVLAVVPISAAIFYGPVYALIAAAILLLLRRKGWRAHVAGALIAPGLMLGSLVLMYAVIEPASDILEGLPILAGFTLVLGYVYVGLVLLGLSFLQRIGRIIDDPA